MRSNVTWVYHSTVLVFRGRCSVLELVIVPIGLLHCSPVAAARLMVVSLVVQEVDLGLRVQVDP